MDRFELRMDKSGSDQQRVGSVVQIALEVGDAVRDEVPRGRDEPGVGGAAAADPVLIAAELTQCLVGSADSFKQKLMGFTQQARGEGQARGLDRFDAVAHRNDVVGRLLDVCGGNARSGVALEEQEVGERRLRAFDLRGEHRLLADVRVEQRVGVGEKCRDPVETPELLVCDPEQALQLGGQLQRRFRWQWPRVERRIAVGSRCHRHEAPGSGRFGSEGEVHHRCLTHPTA